MGGGIRSPHGICPMDWFPLRLIEIRSEDVEGQSKCKDRSQAGILVYFSLKKILVFNKLSTLFCKFEINTAEFHSSFSHNLIPWVGGKKDNQKQTAAINYFSSAISCSYILEKCRIKMEAEWIFINIFGT